MKLWIVPFQMGGRRRDTGRVGYNGNRKDWHRSTSSSSSKSLSFWVSPSSSLSQSSWSWCWKDGYFHCHRDDRPHLHFHSQHCHHHQHYYRHADVVRMDTLEDLQTSGNAPDFEAREGVEDQGLWVFLFSCFFIGPESDHWQCLLVTHSLTHSCLVNLSLIIYCLPLSLTHCLTDWIVNKVGSVFCCWCLVEVWKFNFDWNFEARFGGDFGV